jgi:hypothetical protein
MAAATMSPLAKKLQIRPGMKVALVNAPPGIADILRPLPQDATISRSATSDAVIAFARDKAELAKVAPQAIKLVNAKALIWVCYPKGGTRAGTDLNRDRLWLYLYERFRLQAASLVAVDDTWSAMRFRPQGAGKAWP